MCLKLNEKEHYLRSYGYSRPIVQVATFTVQINRARHKPALSARWFRDKVLRNEIKRIIVNAD